MRRLYLRIYLAVLASLVAFALLAGFLWRTFAEYGPVGQVSHVASELARNILPPAGTPPAEQQAALERIAGNLSADATIFSAERVPLAAVGRPVPPPGADMDESGWVRWRRGPPVWALKLPDERWLVTRIHRPRAHPGWGLFFTLALVALAVGVGAYPVVRRLTRRLETLQGGVESLGAGDLSARVKVEGKDEVAALAESFNRAAARIEALVGAHKAMLANASHELRTPLARIRMAVELAKGDVDEKRKRELEQDVAELDALIDEILLASRLDAAPDAAAEEDVDLLAIAAEEAARYPEAELDGQPATLRGDPRLLRRLVRNLLENAMRHGAPPIELRVARTAGGAEVSVSDHGPGVPEAERERVFEPFYRHAGAKPGAGAGLGLALVRSIARRHGGEARCVPREGGGSLFLVTLGVTQAGRRAAGA